MPIYLMTPRNLDASDWELSTSKTPVQVEATDVPDARVRATMHFAVAAKVNPGAPMRFNPWSSPELVTVELVPSVDPNIRLIKINDQPG